MFSLFTWKSISAQFRTWKMDQNQSNFIKQIVIRIMDVQSPGVTIYEVI